MLEPLAGPDLGENFPLFRMELGRNDDRDWLGDHLGCGEYPKMPGGTAFHVCTTPSSVLLTNRVVGDSTIAASWAPARSTRLWASMFRAIFEGRDDRPARVPNR
jgi:hypothetical protein